MLTPAWLKFSCAGTAYRIARYNLPPRKLLGILSVVGSAGGFAVVTKPPASSKIAIPAATSLNDFNMFATCLRK
jgi:hypothetical protein